MRALAAGAVPVTSRLAPYDELLSEGEYGLEFEPGDVEFYLLNRLESRRSVKLYPLQLRSALPMSDPEPPSLQECWKLDF